MTYAFRVRLMLEAESLKLRFKANVVMANARGLKGSRVKTKACSQGLQPRLEAKYPYSLTIASHN